MKDKKYILLQFGLCSFLTMIDAVTTIMNPHWLGVICTALMGFFAGGWFMRYLDRRDKKDGQQGD